MPYEERDVYAVDVAGVTRELPLFEVAPGVRIAIVNILGDTELVQKAAHALAEKLADFDADVLVTPEAKSIPLSYALAVEMGLPWIVLRKSYKPYMGEPLQAGTQSITTTEAQTLFMDEKDLELVDGQRVILLDDVISTGGTLESMKALVEKAGGEIVARAAIFTEGDPDEWQDVVALGHLPVFTGES